MGLEPRDWLDDVLTDDEGQTQLVLSTQPPHLCKRIDECLSKQEILPGWRPIECEAQSLSLEIVEPRLIAPALETPAPSVISALGEETSRTLGNERSGYVHSAPVALCSHRR